MVNLTGKMFILCKAYCTESINLNILSFTRPDDHGMTTTLALVRRKLIDRYHRIDVLGMLFYTKSE